MSTITTIQDTSIVADSRTTINTNFSNLNTDKKEQADIDSSVSSAITTHAAVQTGVHGLAITSGKTLTVTNNATISGGTHSGTNTGDQTVPVKASGAEIDTGTDDAKFVTAKAINDSHNVPDVAPGTSGNLMTSDGTDWTSAAPPTAVKQIWISRNPASTADSVTAGSAGSFVVDGGSLERIIPFTGTLKNFYIKTGSTVSTGGTQTAVVVVNGSDTALVATITASGTVYSDTTHTVSVTAGDTIKFKLSAAGSSGSNLTCVAWNVELIASS